MGYLGYFGYVGVRDRESIVVSYLEWPQSTRGQSGVGRDHGFNVDPSWESGEALCAKWSFDDLAYSCVQIGWVNGLIKDRQLLQVVIGLRELTGRKLIASLR